MFNITIKTDEDVDHNLLVSLMQSIAPKLNHEWRVSDLEHCDVVIVDMDSSDSEKFLTRCQADLGIIPIRYGRVQPILHSCLQMAKPMRISALASVLNDVAEELYTTRLMGKSTKPLEHHEESKSLYTDFVLNIEKIHRQKKNNSLFSLKLGSEVLFFDEGEDKVYFDERYATSRQKINTLHTGMHFELSRVDARKSLAIKERYRAQHLTFFLWELALLKSDGQLLPHFSDSTRFKLEKWPPFSDISHVNEHFLLAAFLTSRKSGIRRIIAETGLSRDLVVSFINGAYGLKLLSDTSTQASVVEMSPTAQHHGVSPAIKKFFNRILPR